MVFVWDRSGQALMPCTEKRARLLLERGRARVHRWVLLCPWIVAVRRGLRCTLPRAMVPVTPRSRCTGAPRTPHEQRWGLCKGGFGYRWHEHDDRFEVANQKWTALAEEDRGAAVLNLFDLIHRGHQISEALTARSSMRRRRRGNLRYRAPRFLNRGNTKRGWLAPSLQHRINTTLAWVGRFQRWAPISAELSISKARWPATKCGSTCWRSGAASVCIVGPQISHFRSNTFSRAPSKAQIASLI